LIVGTEGDLGDCVVVMGVLSQIPNGPHTLLLQPSEVTKNGGIINSADIVMDLANSQPYIKECRPQIKGEKCDWNSGGFRGANLHHPTKTLFNAHLSHLIQVKRIGQNIRPYKKWLEVKPSKNTNGLILVGCTPRYRNPYFPWQKIVDYYGPEVLRFVGTEVEHADFTSRFGEVPHLKTENLLELAEAIAGSLLFIGNQSVANAIAEGLKHNLVQETSLTLPDCIYIRENAQHSGEGDLIIKVDGFEDLVIEKAKLNYRAYDVSRQPKEGWIFDKQFIGSNWRTAVPNACRMRPDKSTIMVEDELLEQQAERLPELFSKACPHPFNLFREAIKNAQIAFNSSQNQ
jgi:hypothetical protein